MGEQYAQLDLEERCTIARLHEAGQSIRQIAAALDRSPSSISRELKRNRGAKVGYKPGYAQEQARPAAGTAHAWSATMSFAAWSSVPRGGWSPEQIAGRLRRKGGTTISMRASTASSTPRSAAPTTVPGAFTCPAPSTSGAGAAAAIAPPTASSKAVFPSLSAPPTRDPTYLRALGSRSHAVRRSRPGRPGGARAQVPCPIVEQSNPAKPRNPTAERSAGLARAARSAAAPDHHLRPPRCARDDSGVERSSCFNRPTNLKIANLEILAPALWQASVFAPNRHAGDRSSISCWSMRSWS